MCFLPYSYCDLSPNFEPGSEVPVTRGLNFENEYGVVRHETRNPTNSSK